MCLHCLLPVVDKSGTSCYHLVTRLMRPTTTCSNKSDIGLVDIRIQDVFALLVASCWQVWNKLLSSCNKIDEANNNLFQQVWYRSGRHQDSGSVCTTCSQLLTESGTSCYHLGTRLMRPTTTCSNKSDIVWLTSGFRMCLHCLFPDPVVVTSLQQVAITLLRGWWQ
jgi:hypothetical protein